MLNGAHFEEALQKSLKPNERHVQTCVERILLKIKGLNAGKRNWKEGEQLRTLSNALTSDCEAANYSGH